MRHLETHRKDRDKKWECFFETKLIIQIAFRLEISSKNFIVCNEKFIFKTINFVLKINFYLGIEYESFYIFVYKISLITSKNGIFNGVLTFQVTWLVMKFSLVTERWSISAVLGAHLLRFFYSSSFAVFSKTSKILGHRKRLQGYSGSFFI